MKKDLSISLCIIATLSILTILVAYILIPNTPNVYGRDLEVITVRDGNINRFKISGFKEISRVYRLLSYKIKEVMYSDLYEESSVTALVEILNSTSYWIYRHPTKVGPHGDIFTIYRARVLMSFKGNVSSGDIIYIFSFLEGYDPEDGNYDLPLYKNIWKPRERYIFFLYDFSWPFTYPIPENLTLPKPLYSFYPIYLFVRNGKVYSLDHFLSEWKHYMPINQRVDKVSIDDFVKKYFSESG